VRDPIAHTGLAHTGLAHAGLARPAGPRRIARAGSCDLTLVPASIGPQIQDGLPAVTGAPALAGSIEAMVENQAAT